MWLVWLAVGLAAVALICAIAGIASKGASGPSGPPGPPGSGSGSMATYGSRCAATLAASTLSQIDMLNMDAPAAARAVWLNAAGTPLVSGALPAQFGAMADGSPLPDDLMCQLLAGCTAGRWAQVTPEGNCYAISGIASGWSPCTAAQEAMYKPLGPQLAISCPIV